MEHPHNRFGWVDHSSTDQDTAKKFYSELFGWEGTDEEIPTGGYYTNFRKDGKQVAGLGGAQDPNMPSLWNSYLIVDSADEAVKAAKEAGARLFMEPMDVMEFGRMAFLADPSGAAFGVWEPKSHHGAEVQGEPGSVMWMELASTDVDKARKFYEEAFGWKWDEMDMGDGQTYYVEGPEKQQNSGAMQMSENVPAGTPSHWAVYFQVGDIDASAKKATDLGATDVSGRIDAPGVGLMHLLADPTGATFYIMEPVEGEMDLPERKK